MTNQTIEKEELTLPAVVSQTIPAEVFSLFEKAESYKGFEATVKTTEDANQASGSLAEYTQLEKDIEKARLEMTKPFDDMKSKIKAYFDERKKIVSDAKQITKDAVNKFFEEEEKRKREAARLEQEKAAKEKEKLERKAEKLEEKGQTEKAELVRETAQMVVPEIQEETKIAGVTRVMTWKGLVVDDKAKMELVKAVANGLVPLNVLDVNQSILDKAASMFQNSLVWPGVTVKSESGVKATGKRKK